MPQGVHLQIPDVADALIQSDGVISVAAKKLNVHRQSLSEMISRNPELHPLLKQLRLNYEEKRLDAAENIHDKFITQWEKYPKLALQATNYILDNHGKKRGYNRSKEEVQEQNNADLSKDFKLFMEFLKFQQSSRSQDESSNNNEQKS